MKFPFLILFATAFHACEADKTPQKVKSTFQPQTPTVSEAPATDTPEFPKASAAAVYTYELIPAENTTFGYEIMQDSRTLIRQTTIPGMAGNSGFATKEDATKVAELVLTKLKNGEMPPTVSEAEMKQLGAIK